MSSGYSSSGRRPGGGLGARIEAMASHAGGRVVRAREHNAAEVSHEMSLKGKASRDFVNVALSSIWMVDSELPAEFQSAAESTTTQRRAMPFNRSDSRSTLPPLPSVAQLSAQVADELAFITHSESIDDLLHAASSNAAQAAQMQRRKASEPAPHTVPGDGSAAQTDGGAEDETARPPHEERAPTGTGADAPAEEDALHEEAGVSISISVPQPKAATAPAAEPDGESGGIGGGHGMGGESGERVGTADTHASALSRESLWSQLSAGASISYRQFDPNASGPAVLSAAEIFSAKLAAGAEKHARRQHEHAPASEHAAPAAAAEAPASRSPAAGGDGPRRPGARPARTAARVTRPPRPVSVPWTNIEAVHTSEPALQLEHALAQLRRTPFFDDYDEDELADVVRQGSVMRYERYGCVYREGVLGRSVFVVLRGRLRLVSFRGEVSLLDGASPTQPEGSLLQLVAGGLCFGLEACAESDGRPIPRLGTALAASADVLLLALPRGALGHRDASLRAELSAYVLTHILESNWIFRGLPADEIFKVAPLFHFRQVSSGTVMMRQGEVATDFFVVAVGSFRAVRSDVGVKEALKNPAYDLGYKGGTGQSGREQAPTRVQTVLGASQPFSHFGEGGLIAFLEGRTVERMATVEADTQSWVLALEPQHFGQFADAMPDVMTRFQRHHRLLDKLNKDHAVEVRQRDTVRGMMRETEMYGDALSRAIVRTHEQRMDDAAASRMLAGGSIRARRDEGERDDERSSERGMHAPAGRQAPGGAAVEAVALSTPEVHVEGEEEEGEGAGTTARTSGDRGALSAVRFAAKLRRGASETRLSGAGRAAAAADGKLPPLQQSRTSTASVASRSSSTSQQTLSRPGSRASMRPRSQRSSGRPSRRTSIEQKIDAQEEELMFAGVAETLRAEPPEYFDSRQLQLLQRLSD